MHWLLALALAHDDHAPTASASDTLRVAAAGTSLEAVLVVSHDAEQASEARLLVADATTSAPIDVSATLQLTGPTGSPTLVVEPGRDPGVHELSWPSLPAGTWAAALVVTAPADLLALDGIALHHADGKPTDVPWRLGWPIALIAAVAIGWTLGRRGTVAIALLVPVRGPAHGGDAHLAAASGPNIPLDGQFLVGLRTERAAFAPIQPTADAWGHLIPAPGDTLTVRAPVSGTFHTGDALTPGRTLAGQAGWVTEDLDAAGRAARQAAHADATTRAAQAERDLALAERDVQQSDPSFLSGRTVLERARGVEAARVALVEAERAVAAARETLDTPVPARGKVVRTFVADGERVQAGDPIATVTRADAAWVEIIVPQELADELFAGGRALISDPRTPDVWLDATLLDASAVVDDTATIRVLATLDTDDRRGLLPGMAVEARVGTGPPCDGLTVPTRSIIQSDGLPTVFVKIGPESFEARTVALGASDGARRVVLRGLAPGDRVVVDGVSAVRGALGR